MTIIKWFSVSVLTVVLALSANCQEILFEKNPAIDSVVPKWGPNREHYSHFLMGVGFAVDKGEKGAEIRQPHFFDEFRIGYRYKRRLNNTFAIGSELLYNVQSFSLHQNHQKTLPDTLLYIRQLMIFHQFRGGVFFRINYGRRGNNLGKYFDLGAFGDLNMRHTLFTKFENNDHSITKANTTHLKYFNHFGYGLLFRAGFKHFGIYGQYRLSDFFYPSWKLPELPRVNIGIEGYF